MRISAAVNRTVRWGLVGLACASLSGCFAIHESFVDARIKDVDSSEFKAPAVPHPVQLIYEFQTKDVANAKATEATKDAVYAQVAKSPLFSSVSDKPVEGGALLIIRVNNKSATDQHEVGKGLLTGLTWGLAGNVVEDHYFGSARYLPAGNTTPIEVRDEHAIREPRCRKYARYGLRHDRHRLRQT
jgi:hypothetical protein